MKRRYDRKKIIQELARLAFSDPTDAVALAFLPEGSDISGMNVSMVTELKVGEKGGNQVKLLDRVELIRLLVELVGRDDVQCAESFFLALGAAGADAEREGRTPLDFCLCGFADDGSVRPFPRQDLLLFTPYEPEPDAPYGVSMLRGMPFLADILMNIYHSVGVNWERAGNVRYSVVYRPQGDGLDAGGAYERAREIAGEWASAMQASKRGEVRDFVSVGDVEIKVIGADGPVLDSEVPVRQILEQLVAKTGLPPFLLGLNWSSTERMSSQQADLMTSELTAIRRGLTPVLEKICRLWLRMHGYACVPEIQWDPINLQDDVEEARARLYDAQARQLLGEEQT